MMANRSVAIVHLGRAGGLGTHRRVASLRALFESAGATVSEVALRADHPSRLNDLAHPGLRALLDGRAVPESVAWSHRGVLDELHRLRAEIVVCVTGRAYHPDLDCGPWHVVLDYVDRLSVSYRDRARILGRTTRSFLYRVLSRTAMRQERSIPSGVTAIAAGWSDARALGAEWVPITVESPSALPSIEPDHDAVFFGTLSYEPNVEAVRRLVRIWPLVLTNRPGARLLVAGATPTDEVTTLARQHGWTLLADVPDVGATLRRSRLAVAPLMHASGLQIKVLEAAAFGIAQVVDPVALGGFVPGFPAAVADDDAAFARKIVELLADDGRREALASRARAVVAEEYSVAHWTSWAEKLVDQTTPA
jgi:glycosyltransferase involved in cell wall biosynthesis